MTDVFNYAGSFAGDKDAAARLREEVIRPALNRGEVVSLNFGHVEFATQSFVHALLAAIIREDPSRLDRIEFQGCSSDVQSLIEIVVDYAQERFDSGSANATDRMK